MNRRTYLRGVGVAGLGAAGGCLDADGDGEPTAQTTVMPASDDAVLAPPADVQYDPEVAAWPTYGDPLPDFEASAPLHDETVATADFEGDRAILLTFFYTHCPDGVCPALIQRLRQVQAYAADQGVTDEVAFLAVTFDPERDTAPVLSTYADEQGVDRSMGNWYFLRPATVDAARAIVDERYGMVLEKRDPDDGDDHDGTAHEDADYVFPHYELIVLANEAGYVERSYPQLSAAPAAEIQDDLQAVLEGE